MIKLALELDKILSNGPNVLFYLEPDVFVDSLKIYLISKSHKTCIDVSKDNFIEIAGYLKASVFDEGVSIIGWNFKNFFSAAKKWTGTNFNCEAQLLDLKIAESFLNIRNSKPPISFDEMKARLIIVLNHPSWKIFKDLYQKIYVPLFSEVLPDIENEGLFDVVGRKILYPYYEIEGQANGRLACHKVAENSFNPHSMSEEEKKRYMPKGVEHTFLYLDYLHMEVSVLAWLSNDEQLLQILHRNEDFYKALFKLLSGTDAETPTQRDFCKNVFLPVIYGQGAESLASKIGVEIDTAYKIIDKLDKLFPQLFGWIESYPSEDGLFKDFFGRCRLFEQSKEYKYRNFIIQSPAAMFCLEKLVNLYGDLGDYGDLVAHIHDGYLIKVEDKRANEVLYLAKDSLESRSDILPGLKLRINSKIGKTLA